MLKRRLKLDLPNPDAVDAMSYRELIRTSAEQGFVDDPSAWFVYRDRRNLTSHAYDATKAQEVFAILPAFARDARSLLERLHRRENADD